MKKHLIEKSYQPFFGTALFAVVIALFLKIVHPESVVDLSLYDKYFSMPSSSAWFAFSIYLFFLAAIYFIISRSRLKSKHWLVVSHYVFIVLFLTFFVLFSAFESHDVQDIISGIPLSTIISIYGLVFIADVLFFAIGILLLFANLLTLKKTSRKN